MFNDTLELMLLVGYLKTLLDPTEQWKKRVYQHHRLKQSNRDWKNKNKQSMVLTKKR
jgi:fatty-acid desaturase